MEKVENTKVIKEIYKKLSAPIDPKYIVEYEEDGKKLNGFKAIAAINRLNEVFGINNWTTHTEFRKEEQTKNGFMVAIRLKLQIKVNDCFIEREGCGGAYAKKVENAYKAALTSAFKNACKYLGIGRELYLESFDEEEIQYVACEQEEVIPGEIKQLIDTFMVCNSLDEVKQFVPQIQAIKDIELQKKVMKAFNGKKISLMK